MSDKDEANKKRAQYAKDRYDANQEIKNVPETAYDAAVREQELERRIKAGEATEEEVADHDEQKAVMAAITEAQKESNALKPAPRKHKGLRGLANRPEKAFPTFKTDRLRINPKAGVAKMFDFRLATEHKLSDWFERGWMHAKASDFIDDHNLPETVTTKDGSSAVKRNELFVIKIPKEKNEHYKKFLRQRRAVQTTSLADKAIMLGCTRPVGLQGGGKHMKLIFPGETIPREITKEDQRRILEAWEEEFGIPADQ